MLSLGEVLMLLECANLIHKPVFLGPVDEEEVVVNMRGSCPAGISYKLHCNLLLLFLLFIIRLKK